MTPNRGENPIAPAVPQAEPAAEDASLLFRNAAAAKDRGDIHEAEDLTRRAVEWLERQPGPQHPDVAFGLNNLGMFASKRGDLTQAAALLRRACEVSRAVVGEGDARYVKVLQNLADVLQQSGDHAAAKPIHHQILRIRRARFGEDHPICALSLSNLGAVHMRLGEMRWASLTHLQALRVRRTALGPAHPLTVQTLLDLVAIAWKQLDWVKADTLMTEVVAAQEANPDPDRIELANSHSRRAIVRLKLLDLDGAEHHLGRALTLRKQVQGSDHPDYLNCLRDLRYLHEHRRARLGGPVPPGQSATDAAARGANGALTIGREAPPPAGGENSRADAADASARPPHVAPPTGTSPAPAPAPHRSATAVEAVWINPDAAEPPPPPTLGTGLRVATDLPAQAARPTAAFRGWHGGGECQSRSRPMDPSFHDLPHELQSLGEALVALGDQFLVAASQFHHPGTFPDPGLLEEVGRRQEEFRALRDLAVREAETLGVALPPDDQLASVHGLTLLVDAISAEQSNRERLGDVRRRAREVVENVRRLRYLGPAPLPPLVECQAAAKALGDALAVEHGGPSLSEETRLLADGGHPLERFLRLVVHRDELGVDEWAELHEQVVSTYGRTLAAAVALSRVILPPDEPSTEPVAAGRDDLGALGQPLTESAASSVTVP